MKRAYAQEVLVCPRCAGPMAMIAFIGDARVAQRMLAHLGMPTRASPGGVRALPVQARRDEAPNRFEGPDPPVDDD